MRTVHDRLAEARVALGFQSKADFAKHVGIERSSYDKMEKGPHKPSADNMERIIDRFPQLSLNWLLRGKGEMLLDTSRTEAPVLTSGEATVEYAGQLASNGVLRELIDNQKETIADLRGTVAFLKEELGKFGGSLEAALHGLVPTGPRAGALATV